MLVGVLVALLAAPLAPAEPVTLEGRLVVERQGSYVEHAGRRVLLYSEDHDLAATLSDERLSGRSVKLEGEVRSDGRLAVRRLYVVRSDGLYRILYYCYT